MQTNWFSGSRWQTGELDWPSKALESDGLAVPLVNVNWKEQLWRRVIKRIVKFVAAKDKHTPSR